MRVWPCYAAAVEGGPVARAYPAAREVGVSMARAAAELAVALAKAPIRPDLLVLFGVGGAYPARHLAAGQEALAPGELCWIGREDFADLGVESEAGFLDLASLGLEALGPLEMDPTWTHALAARTGHRVVPGCTVAAGAGTEASSAALARRSGALVESMEGAAVAWVCRRFGVPMVQLRAISNFTGDRARGAWDLDGACTKVQTSVLEVLAALDAVDSPAELGRAAHQPEEKP